MDQLEKLTAKQIAAAAEEQLASLPPDVETAENLLNELEKQEGIHISKRKEDPRLREREFSGTFQRHGVDRTDGVLLLRMFFALFCTIWGLRLK